jgi:hypothetical protein
MGLLDFFRKLAGAAREPAVSARPARWGVDELARRLGMGVAELTAIKAQYQFFEIPKRSGGKRRIAAPSPELKTLQRRILRRVLGRLRAHPHATGFERNHSIVTNARPHVGQAVVLRLDIRDFFGSTRAARIHDYLRWIGWDEAAAQLLVQLCCLDGALPQGAPTSPRLANLVNYRLDAQLLGLARRFQATYTRYADDLFFSLSEDTPGPTHRLIRAVESAVARAGYRLHIKRKLRIRRRYEQQSVTGLVVNQKVDLPRRTRRWLRAVEHRFRSGGNATLTEAQFAGWQALRHMITTQRA